MNCEHEPVHFPVYELDKNWFNREEEHENREVSDSISLG